jgi:hypothetical protein
VIPLTFEERPGYWLNDATFDKTLYKLNDGRSCEVAIKYERQESARVKTDNKRLFTERDSARAQVNQLRDQLTTQQGQHTRDRQEWNAKLLDEKNRHLKSTLRLGSFTIGLAITTWLLGKTGIL